MCGVEEEQGDSFCFNITDMLVEIQKKTESYHL